MADVKYIVEAELSQAQSEIKGLDQTIDELGGTSDKTAEKSDNLFAKIAGGQFVANLATKAFDQLTAFVMDSGKAFMEADRIQQEMISTLKVLGIATDANIKKFDAFASEIQRTTTYEDDAVKSVMALGMRMGISSDQIEDATKKAIGLSKAFGLDLEASMKMVAQASEGVYDIMGRYIPQIRTATTEAEKMEAAQRAMADGFVMATDEAGTLSGQIKQQQNAMGDAQEKIGFLVASFQNLTMKAISPCVDILVEFVGWLGRIDEKSIEDNIARRWQENKDAFEAAAKAAGVLESEQKKLFEQHGNISKTEHGVRLYADALDDLISKNAAAARGFNEWMKGSQYANTAAKELTFTLKDQKKQQTDVNKESNESAKVAKLAAKNWDTWDAAMKVAAKSGRAAAKEIAGMEPPLVGVSDAAEEARRDIERLANSGRMSAGRFSLAWQNALDEFLQNWGEVANQTSNILSGIDNLISASYQKKYLLMDEEYNRRLTQLQAQNLSETEYQTAVTKLDEEFAAKRAETAKKEAKAKKAVAIVQAIINTALAVTSALTTQPFIPMGPIAAALALAAGIIQIATIKAQPLAKGAIFNRPAMLESMSTGNKYEVAEAGEAEIVSSPSRLREAIMGRRGSRSDRTGERSGMLLELTLPIYIGTQKIQEHVIRIVEDAAAIGKLRIASRAVA